MTFLYATNLLFAIALLGWPLWFSVSRLKLHWLNPLTIPMFLGLPVGLMRLIVGPMVLVDGGLWSQDFQYAVLMSNVLAISQLAGLLVFFSLAGTLKIERYLPFRSLLMTSGHLQRARWLFLAIFCGSFYLLASAQFGLIDWLKNPRLGYQLYRVGEGEWYALAVNALAVAAMLSFVVRPIPRVVLGKMAFFLCLAYLLGSKGVMLAVFASALAVLSFTRWEQLPKVFMIGAPIIFLALIWNLYLALTDSFDLRSVVDYFDYYKNAADYYQGIRTGDIHLFHGTVLLSSLWAYVPRALVPSKPFVYGILHVNEIFFPGQAQLTNTPDFGGAVAEYADFGVMGVVVLGFFSAQSLLNAIVFRLAFRSPGFLFDRPTVGGFLVILALCGPLFGLYFPGLLYWALLAFVAVGILVLLAPRSGRATSGARNGTVRRHYPVTPGINSGSLT